MSWYIKVEPDQYEVLAIAATDIGRGILMLIADIMAENFWPSSSPNDLKKQQMELGLFI